MGIPSELIEQARSVAVETVIANRGIKLRGTADRCGPCPNCGGHDRFSVSVKKQVFLCRGCGAKGGVIDLVMHIDGCDFKDAVQRLAGTPWTPARAPSPIRAIRRAEGVSDGAERDLASVQKIVSTIGPLIGTPGEAYLRDVRKIDAAEIHDLLNRSDAVGWHPSVYFNEPGHALHGQRLGCIVVVMTDATTAKPTGAISRTYLAPDGTKVCKAKTLGRPLGIVRVSPDDQVLDGLHIAEGLETALTGMANFGCRPMWSTGTSCVMRAFPVLSGIKALSVFVDNDAKNGAGEKAARELEARWLAASKEVKLYLRDAPGDLNDALRDAS